MKTVTALTLKAKKQLEKFAVVAAYDACFSAALCTAGVEVILVGDSLGMVIQGHDSTIPVSIADIAYHTQCVQRGNDGALIIADMPFMSYSNPQQTLSNASILMQAGAHMVKLEGGQWLADSVQQLSTCGIPVCGHLGLTPQSVNKLGGYKVQGRDPVDAQRILSDAQTLEAAGASLLVLECVPSKLAAKISQTLAIPVIGIGAGSDTDAQVLVLHDLLGLNPRPPRFVRDFSAGSGSLQLALEAYVNAVKNGEFPSAAHSFD